MLARQHVSAIAPTATNSPAMAIRLHESNTPTPMRNSEVVSGTEIVDPQNHPERDTCSCGLAEGLEEAYNEQAFRHFLAIEGRRSERCDRPLLLLLADLKGQSGQETPIEPGIACQLFSALILCLRETDFVGWYREGRVVGAVLTQRASIATADLSQRVADRLTSVLDQHLPQDISQRLQLRVFQIPSRPKEERL
jgi:hypothetical protein